MDDTAGNVIYIRFVKIIQIVNGSGIIINDSGNIMPYAIAGSIDAGLVCFLNTNTLQIDELPKELVASPAMYKMETGMSIKDFKPKYTRWKKYITIEPLESNESFKIMEKFVDQLDNSKLRKRLVYALNNRKPFANFKNIIDNSDIRQDWFDFKDEKLQEYVKSMIEINIPDELN